LANGNKNKTEEMGVRFVEREVNVGGGDMNKKMI
jgi:hypothetical protein